MIEDLLPFYDDGNEGMQHLIARLPLLLEAQRAYIVRYSTDRQRFTVTQASTGDWPNLLGYTQAVARLPVFARSSLRSGVQADVEDCATFPFTQQQRKMPLYAGVGATVFTPIQTVGGIAGALVVDQLGSRRPWDTSHLEACKSLSEAIGARIALATLGDHLAVEDDPAGRAIARLNVLANIARLIDRAGDAAAATTGLVELLEGLPWVDAARLAEPDASDVVREALAHERLVVRNLGAKTTLGVPVTFEGEKFGGLEIVLEERLTAHDEQFWRSVQTFAGSAYAGALRRSRSRDGNLTDALTGLPNFRAANEGLSEMVHAAKSSGRVISAWLIDVEGLAAVNLAQGYASGDDIVGYVGHTLGQIVTGRGSVGRVGGGLFLALFPGMDAEESSVQARMMVERIVKNAPGHLPAVALTIGASVYPSEATGYDDLVRSARLALYTAKSRGSNTVEVAKMKDDVWLRSAHNAFVRIVTQQQLPAAMTSIRK